MKALVDAKNESEKDEGEKNNLKSLSLITIPEQIKKEQIENSNYESTQQSDACLESVSTGKVKTAI